MWPSVLIATLALTLGIAEAPAAAAAAPAPITCGATLGRAAQPVNHWAATKTTLLPAGAVAMTLCRYQTQTSRRLIVQHQLSSGSELTSLIRRLRSLPKVPSGVFNCPADFGPSVAIFARYPGHPRVELVVDESGCVSVTNGHVIRMTNQPLIKQLNRLLPLPEQ